MTGNIVPYAIENSPRPGFAIEIVREMARRAGLEVGIEFLPWQRAMAEARTRPGLAIAPLIRTAEREASYSWIAEIAPAEPFFLIAVRPDVDLSSLDAVRARLVAGMANAPSEGILKRAGLPNIDLSTENLVNARKLIKGRVDVWLGRAAEARHAMTQLGEDPARLRFGPPIAAPPSYLAANRNFPPDQARRLVLALETMRADGSWAAIVRSYGVDPSTPSVPAR